MSQFVLLSALYHSKKNKGFESGFRITVVIYMTFPGPENTNLKSPGLS